MSRRGEDAISAHAVEGRLAGKVAVVTGAASGLGRGIAQRLAAEGASVVCGDLQEAPVQGGLDEDVPTHETIARAGGKAAFVEWDVTDSTQTAKAIELASTRFGRLDIVVANAGIGRVGPTLPAEDPAEWQRHIDTNLTGTFGTVRLGMKALIEQGEGGRVVLMSSIAALIGIAGLPSVYGVTKAGLVQMARQAAVDGGPHGITANAVCPGYVRTAINSDLWKDPKEAELASDRHPLRRLGEVSDVVGAVAFLASPDASWITGASLTVDGGFTCV